ncbi:hypothetical protein J4460_06420 [Candidatus Woesearchaeota archaeon]|nr:MAG: hypothetical protein QS99_C0010G0044 [archaeon GW2011_AR4]MBS3130278.1 hypothetical protein [Candidatus Woesearchaeota archaeon]HIH38209.1 hypothetical protein [Candidatus Woesearchaeota archaeon]HIH49504.1 hypothetical protein [Candidatus Woesearchaeota archaeon]HIJ03886.1 hypothetical protein [Candidatus Woesearchaeota archaeon]
MQEHEFFYARDGTVVQDIPGLKKALSQMDDAAYSHHVSAHKNDFSSWIAHVLKDRPLAEKIQGDIPKPVMIQLLGAVPKKVAKKENATSMKVVKTKAVQVKNQVPAIRQNTIKQKRPESLQVKKVEAKVAKTLKKTRAMPSSKKHSLPAKSFSFDQVRVFFQDSVITRTEFIEGLVVGLFIGIILSILIL